jgi:hypothetical protein
LNAWKRKGIAKEKMVVGIPIFGRSFLLAEGRLVAPGLAPIFKNTFAITITITITITNWRF